MNEHSAILLAMLDRGAIFDTTDHGGILMKRQSLYITIDGKALE